MQEKKDTGIRHRHIVELVNQFVDSSGALSDKVKEQIEAMIDESGEEYLTLLNETAKAVRQEDAHIYHHQKCLWHQFLTKKELQQRREKLLHPASAEELMANLMWFCECGGDEDLPVLREVRKRRQFSSASIRHMLDLAEIRLCMRAYDPQCVAMQGEEAFQNHQEEWSENFAGMYVAILKNEIIAASPDMKMLLEEITELQRCRPPFRAYIRKIEV